MPLLCFLKFHLKNFLVPFPIFHPTYNLVPVVVNDLSGEKPGEIPWAEMNVDFVIDATGAFLDRNELEKHINSGAKRVIVSRTPSDRIDRMVIHGINEDSIDQSDQIISATSSTTQVLGLMLKILDT